MSNHHPVGFEASWLRHLSAEFEQPYMHELRDFLGREKRSGKRIFPAGEEIFSAFSSTPLDAVKVVILGAGSLPWRGTGPRPLLFGETGC